MEHLMQSFMHYFASTHKSFKQVIKDLKDAISRHGYGILHVHNLTEIFKQKGVAFDEECQVFEICSPSQAKRFLKYDMKMSMALPCRISVYTEKKEVFVGMIHPEKTFSDLSDNEIINEVAKEVDATLRQIIDDAK